MTQAAARSCPPGDRLWCQGCHLGNHTCDSVAWCRHRATTGVLMRHDELVKVGIVERHGERFDHAKDADGLWWRWSHTHDMWLGVASSPAPAEGPPPVKTRHEPRAVTHFGIGMTDCGRDGASLPPSHYWTMNPAAVTCGECKDARSHVDTKAGKPRVQ